MDKNKNSDADRQYSDLQIVGRNPVLEAMKKGRAIDKILIKKGETDGTLRVIVNKAKDLGIVVREISKSKLDEIAAAPNHQGVIAYAAAHEYAEVSDILQAAKDKNEPPFLIILDGITDPHNLGAIIRTADAVGAHGVIIPKRRSAALTATVSKASAGAVEYMPVAKVTNIPRLIDDLKNEGIWVACAHTDGQDYFRASLEGPIALVIGSEGQGVGRLIKEKCDFNIKIPMYGEIGSLNASVAAGLVMYEVIRQRKFMV